MSDADGLVRRLRAAGCVFAEEEAFELIGAAADSAALEALVLRRVAGEPMEHLVGHVDLGDLRLAVGPGVFVPRQRSAFLARLATRTALDQVRERIRVVLVEAYAGAAPLAATVARAVPGVEVHATDIDPVALGYASENLPPGAGVHRGSVLDGLPHRLAGRVTLLVAVPPYVPVGSASFLPREAREHEPDTALFAGSDGLDEIRRLVDAAMPWLTPRGRVLLEMHRDQAAAAVLHGERRGFRARSRRARDGQTAVLDLTAP